MSTQIPPPTLSLILGRNVMKKLLKMEKNTFGFTIGLRKFHV